MKLTHLAIAFLVLWPLCAQATIWDSQDLSGSPSSTTLMAFGGDRSPNSNSCKSNLWAIGESGSRGLEISLPQGSAGTLEIVSGAEGYATLLHRLPSGELQSTYLGYVYRGSSYALRIRGEIPGIHEVWYKVGHQESNRVKLQVLC